jgi:hypothetical protein
LHRYRTPRSGGRRLALGKWRAPGQAARRTPVSLAKRDIEMVSHTVTLNWRQSAVRYLAATVAGYSA